MTPVEAPPAAITPEDLLAMPDDGHTYELVDGELREKTVSLKSSRIAGQIYFQLMTFMQTHPVAWVFFQGVGYNCFVDDRNRVRKPDVSVIVFDHMPPETYEDEEFCSVVPDLVVEVTTPHDLYRDVRRKTVQWLLAGVKIVWVVEPADQAVTIYQPGRPTAELTVDATLTADPVLPGFSCRVADLFQLPVRPAAGNVP